MSYKDIVLLDSNIKGVDNGIAQTLTATVEIGQPRRNYKWISQRRRYFNIGRIG